MPKNSIFSYNSYLILVLLLVLLGVFGTSLYLLIFDLTSHHDMDNKWVQYRELYDRADRTETQINDIEHAFSLALLNDDLEELNAVKTETAELEQILLALNRFVKDVEAKKRFDSLKNVLDKLSPMIADIDKAMGKTFDSTNQSNFAILKAKASIFYTTLSDARIAAEQLEEFALKLEANARKTVQEKSNKQHTILYITIGVVLVVILFLVGLWIKVFRSLVVETRHRKALEADNIEHEQKYTALFNNMKVGVFYQRADGVLTDVNQAALDLLSMNRDQFVGKLSKLPDWKVIQEDGSFFPREKYPATVALKTGKTVHDQVAGLKGPKDESFRWLSITAVPQFREGEQTPWQVFVTMIDITPRKQFEFALKQKEKQVQELHDQTEQLSLAAAEMIAMENMEVICQKVADAIVDYSDYQRVIISLFKDEFPFRDIVGFAGLEKNLIDRVRTVEFKKGWYDKVFEQGITIGSFSYYIPHTMKHILNQEATYFGEGPVPDKENVWHPEDNLFVRMNDEKGNFIGVISVDDSKSGEVPSAKTIRPLEIFSILISQIIMLKKEQEKRQNVEAQLHQAMKMESIGTLAGGIAHDFNNILGIILGNTELALDDMSEEDPAYEELKEIRDASLRAADIVKQLLSFSRKTDQHLGPIDIIPVVRDTLNFMRSSIPATVDIDPCITAGEAIVMADPIQINRILMNLCINAFQAMPDEKGRIEIKVDAMELTWKNISMANGLKPGPYVRIKVNDNGQGISSDILDRIFDPYFTTKDVGKGSGMGLAVVVGIVKAHNGDIWVDSKPGKGTRFTICLPVTQKQPDSSKKEVQQITEHGSERILFVDDDMAITDMYKKNLAQMGYQITEVNDPGEAFRVFEKSPGSFDLVITDMTMPGMTGSDLAKKIMAVRTNIPIIICTGHSDLIDEKTAVDMGIAALVSKPVPRNEMGLVIRDALSG